MIARLSLLLAVSLLMACSSQQEPKTPPLMSQRISNSMKRMQDPNDRSVYDKAMQSTITQGKDTGGWLGRQKYGAKSFTGSKNYTNTPKVKTPEFSGADTNTALAQKNFSGSDQVAAMADDTFDAKPSRLGSQTSREGSKTFREAGDMFKTRSNRAALKSQEKNDRPEFIQLEEMSKGPAYTEDEVRKLLGRN